MLFSEKEKLTIVSSCPVTRGSSGVLEFAPELIPVIAGAVTDNIEWMVLLTGTISDDGFHAKVTGFRVPQQRRTSGDVSMTEPMEGPESTIGEDVVGVLHSHHSMGNFFSHTDNTELNPHFKTSIVVSQGANTALGFKYKAEGRVMLSCGSIGKVDFWLAITGSERWAAQVVHDHKRDGGLGDCDRVAESVEETVDEVVKVQATDPCVIIDGVLSPLTCNRREEKPLVHGVAGGEALLAEIRKMTTGYHHQNGHYAYERRTSVPHNGSQQGVFSSGDNSVGEHLSRKERKRLKREGKLGATRAGLSLIGFSRPNRPCDSFTSVINPVQTGTRCDNCGFMYYYHGEAIIAEPCAEFKLAAGVQWDHGMKCITCDYTRYQHEEADKERAEDETASNFVAKLPHTYAASSMISFGRECDLCTKPPTDGKLYMYVGQQSDWRAWMDEGCYDWYVEDAQEMGEQSADEAGLSALEERGGQLEMCRKFGHIHTIGSKGVVFCKTCADRGELPERQARAALAPEKSVEERTAIRERLGVAGLLPPAQQVH